jgi:hypothetical protein
MLAGCGHFSPRAWPQNTAVHIQSFACISPIFLLVVLEHSDFILVQRQGNKFVSRTKSRVLLRTVGHANVRLRKSSAGCASLTLSLQPKFPQYLLVISRNLSAFCGSTTGVVTT